MGRPSPDGSTWIRAPSPGFLLAHQTRPWPAGSTLGACLYLLYLVLFSLEIYLNLALAPSPFAATKSLNQRGSPRLSSVAAVGELALCRGAEREFRDALVR